MTQVLPTYVGREEKETVENKRELIRDMNCNQADSLWS
jgi:hypothetical protein